MKMYLVVIALISIILHLSIKLLKNRVFLFSLWNLFLIFEIALSLISFLFLNQFTANKFEISETFIYVFCVSTVCLWIGFAFSRKKQRNIETFFLHGQNKIDLKKLDLSILLSFIIFSVVAIKVLIVYKNSSSEFGARKDLIGEMSGIEFIIYKLGFIILALIAFRRTIKTLPIYLILFSFFIFLSYWVYGGRFLIFNSVLVFFLTLKFNRLRNLRRIKVSLVLLLLVAYLSLSIFYANTRYYLSNEYTFAQTITLDKFANTAYMQLGGNSLDFTRVEQSNLRIDLSESFFPTALEGFLPNALRNELFPSFFKKKLAFGSFFASTIDEDDNALRLNFTNEVYFAFGYFGVIVYSFLLGFFLGKFESYLQGFKYPIGIFFFMQVLALHILGINTFSNFVILTLAIIWLFGYSSTRRKALMQPHIYGKESLTFN
jgi:hypothetical protein